LDRAGHIVRARNSAKVGGAGEAAADFQRVAALALQSNRQAIRRRAIQKRIINIMILQVFGFEVVVNGFDCMILSKSTPRPECRFDCASNGANENVDATAGYSRHHYMTRPFVVTKSCWKERKKRIDACG
jgi:hypothetical protein